jgi:RNA polymerase sigma-70 factor (sigma-E family)
MTCLQAAPTHRHTPRSEVEAGARPGGIAEDAFVDFVQAHTPALTRTASVLTGSASAAEELVQDTLVRLYPKWSRVQNAEVPLAYVRRALTNRFLTTWRRTGEREVVTDAVPERAVDRSAESGVNDRDEVRTLLQMLNRRQHCVIVLRYYEGLNDIEIAEVLGCQPGTARSLISRGLTALRQAAAQQETS